MKEELFRLLKTNKYKLTKQQYKTIKGQIKKEDYQGARKGIFTCLLKDIK